MANIPFSIIFARDALSGGFGFKNKIPEWKYNKIDLLNFKNITTNNENNVKNILIMGKNTFYSLPKLEDRINFIVSKSLKKEHDSSKDESFFFNSLSEALIYGNKHYNKSKIFIIGGIDLINEALSTYYRYNHKTGRSDILELIFKNLEYIYETLVICDNIKDNIFYDKFLKKEIPNIIELQSTKTVGNYIFNVYINNYNSPEKYYLNLMRKVLDEGEYRSDRTGTNVYSLFSPQTLEFNINEYFPLLTTKRISLRLVFEELMWFLQGQTNAKILTEKNVHIWDGNSSKSYLEKLGLDYPEGECGPIYGCQWRNFGGEHDIKESNHIGEYPLTSEGKSKGKGFDQIKFLINEIKTNPTSRRLILSAWNPLVFDKIALPSCHCFCQFYVRNNVYLDCKVYIRSNDLFLGMPFNIASYTLLTMILAKMTTKVAGKLYYTIGDAHLYKNHIEQVKIQLTRSIRKFPVLYIKNIPNNIDDISLLKFENLELSDYYPHNSIKGDMAV